MMLSNVPFFPHTAPSLEQRRLVAALHCLLAVCALFLISSCGGANSTFDPVSGTLSIEGVSNANSGGSVAVKLISPHGSGPGTGTITISADRPDLITFTPTSQTADSSGNAVFSFTTTETQTDTAVNYTVAVGALSLTRQIIIPGTGALSLAITPPSGANAAGTVTVSYAGGSKAAGRTVTITSDNSAGIAFDTTSQTTDANGQAVFNYRAVSLATDTAVKFTATSSAQTASQSVLIPATVTTAPPVVPNAPVNSIAYVSASPTSISLKGAGGAGRSETSVVTFIVKDTTGTAMPNQTVDFSLDTSIGGLTLLPNSAVSDSTGTVKTIVNAGVVATPVRVTATVHGTGISVKSDQLTISTGLPHQDGLSLSVGTYNPEAWDFDNVQVPVTVMLSDHFGNPVPDGTAVYFTSYGGSIEPSATTQNGIATVNWRSQNPRPTGNHDANGVAGRAIILAYAIGEESFTDLNGNGVADPGEFTDMPEAFLAKSWTTDPTRNYCNPSLPNYAPLRDPTFCLVRNSAFDPFFDFNGDGIYNTGDGKFNGVLQGSASVGAPRSLYVFINRQIVMSGSHATISLLTSNINASTNPGVIMRSTPVTFTVTDDRGNIMPKGTTISLSSTTGACTTPVDTGLTISPNAMPVDNRLEPASFNTTLSTYCAAGNSGNLIVTVTTPNGIVTTQTVPVSIR